MDQPNDVSSSASLKAGIDKLFQIENLAAYLSCQIQEVTGIFTNAVAIDEGQDEIMLEDLTVLNRMNTAELMEMSNLENTRQALVKSWRYIESRKAGIIQAAKAREQGRANNHG